MRRGRKLPNFSSVPDQKDGVIFGIEKRLRSSNDASALRYAVGNVAHDRGQLGALHRGESLRRFRAIQAQLPECLALLPDDTVQHMMCVKMAEDFVVVRRLLDCRRWANRYHGVEGLGALDECVSEGRFAGLIIVLEIELHHRRRKQALGIEIGHVALGVDPEESGRIGAYELADRFEERRHQLLARQTEAAKLADMIPKVRRLHVWAARRA